MKKIYREMPEGIQKQLIFEQKKSIYVLFIWFAAVSRMERGYQQ